MVEDVHIIFGIILALIVLLYTEWVRPSASFLLAGVALVGTEVLTTNELLQGFANEQLAVIIMLLIISNMISTSGIIDSLFGFLSGRRTVSPRAFLLKMTTGVGLSSAIFNNTPLVALFMPYVHNWCHKNGQSPSKYLIPLSYASILGGCVTLIGTSTNLIVNGLSMESGLPSLEIFDFALIGGIMLVLGILYLLVLGPGLLPDRTSMQNEESAEDREYFLETHVKTNSPLIGKSIEDAGLRNLKGLFLIEISRGDQTLSPVSPKEVLEFGDVLFFAGDVGSIQDIRDPKLGLSLPKYCNLPDSTEDRIVETVVAHNSRLVGQKIVDSDFRGRYDGAILAVHRDGERLEGKIGDIEIKSGDLLLIMAGKDFISRTKHNPGFYILSSSQPEPEEKADLWKAYVMIAGLIGCIALSFADIPLFKSLAVLLATGVLLQISTPTRIRNSVDFNLVLIIAFGLGLGKAISKTGAADDILNMLGMDQQLEPIVLMGSLFFLTNVLASFITSKAAVAITIPLAVQLIAESGIAFQPIILSVAFGGAANFLTPIGYQTNLMVYGPGRYKFRDFFKVGLPLTLLYGAVSTAVLAAYYDLI